MYTYIYIDIIICCTCACMHVAQITSGIVHRKQNTIGVHIYRSGKKKSSKGLFTMTGHYKQAPSQATRAKTQSMPYCGCREAK